MISAIIPTLDGAATLPPLLDALSRARSRHALEIVAIDSGSRDGTVQLLEKAGARVLDLGGERFAHASARNRAAAHASGDVLLFLTQDVEPVGGTWLEPLLAALDEPGVAGAFGRQVPRGASPEEAFLALVNYGDSPRRITRADLERPFGPGRTYFSSAFGAIRREVWERIPFPPIVMSEDQAWALQALHAGHEIRYVPAAAACHGHAFSLGRAFRRNFDSGASLAQLGLSGGMWAVGPAHLARELRWIARERGPTRMAYTLLYETVRMIAFQCGRMERVMPRVLARTLGEAPRA
jgi:rhamnosyltransferase